MFFSLFLECPPKIFLSGFTWSLQKESIVSNSKIPECDFFCSPIDKHAI
jgi:hypothetical protein